MDWPRINANRNQISQVIHNLVHNAIDAMQLSNQGRVLRLKTERRGDDAIVVEIQDTGSGIDPKQLENIFEAFVTTKKGGTGLGLAISRTIIERHGGQLSASSDGKNGSLFQFVLPIRSIRDNFPTQ